MQIHFARLAIFVSDLPSPRSKCQASRSEAYLCRLLSGVECNSSALPGYRSRCGAQRSSYDPPPQPQGYLLISN